MNEHDTMPRLPTSGQILGSLVGALGISHPILQARTARRYFAADTEHLVKDSSREEIIEAIAEVLTDSGFIALPQNLEGSAKNAPTLTSTLRWHAENWDLFWSFLRRRTVSVQPSHLPRVWEAYLRLAVIDLALRVAAYLHLAGADPAILEILNFVNPRDRGAYLNQKRQLSGLTSECFAEQVKVHDNTVDAWMYQGARPSNDNLTEIAAVLADKIDESTEPGIALELRALYWVSDVADLLSKHVGVGSVEEIIGRLRRYAAASFHLIEDQFLAEERTDKLAVLADLGANARIAEPLLRALIQQEPDAEWQEDLRSTGMDWVRRVLSVNLRVRLEEVDETIEKTDGQLLQDWDVSNPEAYAHYRMSLELQAQGRTSEALAEVEIAARLDPTDPANHFTLGSAKTTIGIRRGDAAQVKEGLDALWLAAALDPKWILPWTEIGSTLLHTDRAAEAVAHLLSIKPECGPLDSGYYSALGAAYWILDKLPQALKAFEDAIELNPEETSCLVAAAELSHLLGDNRKHRLYSRRARHFGADEGTEKFMELLREFGKHVKDVGGPENHDRTIAVMDATIKLNPNDEDAYFNRGMAYFSKEDDDLTLADLDAVLRLNPDNAAAYMLRGIVLGYLKRWDQVVADMSQLIRIEPENAMAHYHRGMAYGEQDLLDNAIADMSEAIRLSPNHSDAYRCRGDSYRYQREYDRAIADFHTAIRLDPENAGAFLGRGAAYRMKGDPDRAIADYDVVIRLEPLKPLGYRFRGDAFVANGKYEEAISSCTSALNLDPSDPLAFFTRGNAHLFNGNLEMALANFNSSLEIDPSSGRTTYGRGLVRQMMGDSVGASEDYRHAEELGYDLKTSRARNEHAA